MSPTNTSNAVLYEMLRSVKEEQLPELHRKMDRVNGSIADAVNDINDLKAFKAEYEGKVSLLWKLLAVIVVPVVLLVIQVFLKK